MNYNVERLFIEGENLLEYGSSPEYPFNSCASLHWRLNGRRILHLAHCLSVIETSDDEVFSTVMRTLKEVE